MPRKLTLAQIRSIQQQIRDRHRETGDPNFIAIGIGKGLRGGVPDPDRPLVVHYAVRKKIKHPKARHAVKPSVTVTLGKNKKLHLPTDVIEIGEMVPTTAPIRSDTEVFSSGYIVSWNDPQSGANTWGFLTVGHGFSNSNSGRATIPYIATVVGSLIHCTAADDPIDAALIQVTPEDIKSMFGDIISDRSPSLTYRAFQALVNDTQQQHAVCTMEYLRGNVAFRLASFFSDSGSGPPLIPLLPNLTNLFFTQILPPIQAFPQGSSGAAWLLAPHVAAAVQIAGNDPHFNNGFAISFHEMLQWASAQVQSQVRLIAIV